MDSPINILIVEDEPLIRKTLCRKLVKEGFFTEEAANGADTRARLESGSPDLVLMDINLPDANGIDLLREAKEKDPDLPVVMMTGNHAIQLVVEAMKLGAFDYITKPFNLDEVMLTIQKALEMTELRRQVKMMRANFELEFGFHRVVGGSTKMRAVMETAKTVAESVAETVLILGESGTGKNLIAQAIHYNSLRASRPFMEVTCTALPATLLESELFGHEKGAFTDARTMKRGLCEMAHQGTLFLDEIGEMPLETQAKLLGFLESRRFRRVGGTRDISVDLRIVAATNQDMEKMIAEKRFREDLYYRLNVIEIHMPALRERPEDIPLLARFFVDFFNRKFKKNIKGIDQAGLDLVSNYPWPGNVRELRNIIERAMILSKNEVLTATDFPLRKKAVPQAQVDESRILLPDQGISITSVEEDLVRQALEKTKGNQTKAAKLLHLSRDQLRYRMKLYDLFD
ncbi:Sigma-54-dependent Fis family transcriptional regulator [Sulfidibacter corallicola]|uniref:Sigma-54-dependent Fis family transcriptional regulator n=1 Tax=Sulfidibacter corallicola TaxID=2818388 RepID=A0A8A4U4L7_SULCO|nr:sigma-54 dependent transcriptional regulator [Sulfidibacter corallicola]QTD53695.1 sigma-54-dependent Fis family transcriptional regulator [Sulfidibacter corallicola]